MSHDEDTKQYLLRFLRHSKFLFQIFKNRFLLLLTNAVNLTYRRMFFCYQNIFFLSFSDMQKWRYQREGKLLSYVQVNPFI